MELRVVALAQADEDAGEGAVWSARLLAELSALEDAQVAVVAGAVPDGTKGVGAATSALLARLASLDTLKSLVRAVLSWTSRTGRSVEVSIDGDVLKLNGASREQQDRVIEAWIARHAPAS